MLCATLELTYSPADMLPTGAGLASSSLAASAEPTSGISWSNNSGSFIVFAPRVMNESVSKSCAEGLGQTQKGTTKNIKCGVLYIYSYDLMCCIYEHAYSCTLQTYLEDLSEGSAQQTFGSGRSR